MKQRKTPIGCSKEADPGQKLLRCSRCLAAHYCNKACQQKDWKRHKKECHRPEECTDGSAGDGHAVDNQSTTNSAMAFVQRYIREIRPRLRLASAVERKRCSGGGGGGGGGDGSRLRDLVLCIDFQDGADTGEFAVVALSQILSRAYLPKFCYDRGGAVVEGNAAGLIAQVQQVHATLTPSMLLVVVRDLAGGCAICRSQLRSPGSGTSFFRDDYLRMSEAEAAAEDSRMKRESDQWVEQQIEQQRRGPGGGGGGGGGRRAVCGDDEEEEVDEDDLNRAMAAIKAFADKTAAAHDK